MGEFLENAGDFFEQMNTQAQIDDDVYAILNNADGSEKDE
jgi:hypothetical protein|tara:strand:- start:2367 stop:2486 length:120 start_codon:yes stop_codon:yes gene_type:complete